MINTRNGMLTCDNKMSAYIVFERDNIPTPRTADDIKRKKFDGCPKE